MNKLLKAIGGYLYNFVFCIGCMSIYSFAVDRWPGPYNVVMVCLFSAFGLWYFGKYLFVPFRQGLRSDKVK